MARVKHKQSMWGQLVRCIWWLFWIKVVLVYAPICFSFLKLKNWYMRLRGFLTPLWPYIHRCQLYGSILLIASICKLACYLFSFDLRWVKYKESIPANPPFTLLSAFSFIYNWTVMMLPPKTLQIIKSAYMQCVNEIIHSSQLANFCIYGIK